MYFVLHFGHAKVYETSIWTPCFQILAKTIPGNRLAIGRAVLYYARATHAFNAGIKCRHCRNDFTLPVPGPSAKA